MLNRRGPRTTYNPRLWCIVMQIMSVGQVHGNRNSNYNVLLNNSTVSRAKLSVTWHQYCILIHFIHILNLLYFCWFNVFWEKAGFLIHSTKNCCKLPSERSFEWKALEFRYIAPIRLVQLSFVYYMLPNPYVQVFK